MALNYKVQNKATVSSFSTNSTSYVNLLDQAGGSGLPFQVTITKEAGTDILISGGWTGFCSGGSANMSIGVNDGTTDYDLFKQRYLSASQFATFCGGDRIITGLGAGTFTFTLRFKTNANTVFIDANSARAYISALELNSSVNVKNKNVQTAATFNMASTVYANVLNQDGGAITQVTLTKGAGTGVLVRGAMSYFCNTITTNTLGVNDGTTDYALGTEDTANNLYAELFGERLITGLAAGTYTFTLRYKLGAGAAAQTAGESAQSLTVMEVAV